MSEQISKIFQEQSRTIADRIIEVYSTCDISESLEYIIYTPPGDELFQLLQYCRKTAAKYIHIKTDKNTTRRIACLRLTFEDDSDIHVWLGEKETENLTAKEVPESERFKMH